MRALWANGKCVLNQGGPSKPFGNRAEKIVRNHDLSCKNSPAADYILTGSDSRLPGTGAPGLNVVGPKGRSIMIAASGREK